MRQGDGKGTEGNREMEVNMRKQPELRTRKMNECEGEGDRRGKLKKSTLQNKNIKKKGKRTIRTRLEKDNKKQRNGMKRKHTLTHTNRTEK